MEEKKDTKLSKHATYQVAQPNYLQSSFPPAQRIGHAVPLADLKGPNLADFPTEEMFSVTVLRTD